MPKRFHFGTLTHSPETKRVESACLGTGPNDQYTDNDLKKAVKMGTKANYVLCAAGDEIEGFIDNIDAGGTENEGFTFGGVARGGRHIAMIGAGQGDTPAKLLDYVVADDQPARGERKLASHLAPGQAEPNVGVPLVKTGEPVRQLWRIVHIYAGDGSEGTLVALDRAN